MGGEGEGSWVVPVRVKGCREGQPLFLLRDDDPDAAKSLRKLLQEADEADEWLMLNAGSTGFFRTNYTLDGWRRIADQALAVQV